MLSSARSQECHSVYGKPGSALALVDLGGFWAA